MAIQTVGSRGTFLDLIQRVAGTETFAGWGKPQNILQNNNYPLYVTDPSNPLLASPSTSVTTSNSGGLTALAGDLQGSLGRFQINESTLVDIKFYQTDSNGAGTASGGLNPYVDYTGVTSTNGLAWNPEVLKTMGITLVKNGASYTDIIQSVDIGAAQTLLNDQSLKAANWNQTSNPLVGQSIFGYARDIIRIFDAGRLANDTSIADATLDPNNNDTGSYTPTAEQAQLALNAQYQAISATWISNYNRYISNYFQYGTPTAPTSGTAKTNDLSKFIGKTVVVDSAVSNAYGVNVGNSYKFVITESALMAAVQIAGGMWTADAFLKKLTDGSGNIGQVDSNGNYHFADSTNSGANYPTYAQYMAIFSGFSTPVGQKYLADGTINTDAATKDGYIFNFGAANSITNSTGTDQNPVQGDAGNGSVVLPYEVSTYGSNSGTTADQTNLAFGVGGNGQTNSFATFTPITSSYTTNPVGSGANGQSAATIDESSLTGNYNILYTSGTTTSVKLSQGNNTVGDVGSAGASATSSDAVTISSAALTAYQTVNYTSSVTKIDVSALGTDWNAIQNKLVYRWWDGTLNSGSGGFNAKGVSEVSSISSGQQLQIVYVKDATSLADAKTKAAGGVTGSWGFLIDKVTDKTAFGGTLDATDFLFTAQSSGSSGSAGTTDLTIDATASNGKNTIHASDTVNTTVLVDSGSNIIFCGAKNDTIKLAPVATGTLGTQIITGYNLTTDKIDLSAFVGLKNTDLTISTSSFDHKDTVDSSGKSVTTDYQISFVSSGKNYIVDVSSQNTTAKTAADLLASVTFPTVVTTNHAPTATITKGGAISTPIRTFSGDVTPLTIGSVADSDAGDAVTIKTNIDSTVGTFSIDASKNLIFTPNAAMTTGNHAVTAIITDGKTGGDTTISANIYGVSNNIVSTGSPTKISDITVTSGTTPTLPSDTNGRFATFNGDIIFIPKAKTTDFTLTNKPITVNSVQDGAITKNFNVTVGDVTRPVDIFAQHGPQIFSTNSNISFSIKDLLKTASLTGLATKTFTLKDDAGNTPTGLKLTTTSSGANITDIKVESTTASGISAANIYKLHVEISDTANANYHYNTNSFGINVIPSIGGAISTAVTAGTLAATDKINTVTNNAITFDRTLHATDNSKVLVNENTGNVGFSIRGNGVYTAINGRSPVAVNNFTKEQISVVGKVKIQDAVYGKQAADGTIADTLTLSSDSEAFTLVNKVLQGSTFNYNQMFYNIKTINTGAGDDIIDCSDVDYNITIDASAQSGNKVLWGGAGNDTIKCGTGNEIVNGGNGDDTITSGGGSNALTGGAGNDIFVYTAVKGSAPTSLDIIKDFVHGSDKIDVSALAFNGIAAGNPNGNATDLCYSYDSINNVTHVQNGNGTFKVDLSGSVALTMDDFIF